MNSSVNVGESLKPLARWLSKHINAPRFLVLMMVVCFLMAWNRGIDLLYGICAIILALLLVSWVMPWWMLRQLRLSRSQVGLAEVGSELRLRYRFAGKPAWYLSVAEQLPNIPELQTHFIAYADANTPVALNYLCAQRGIFTLPKPEVSCGWPFGFIQRRLTLVSEDCQIIVAPKPAVIRRLPAPIQDAQTVDGQESQQIFSGHSDFSGVRDYRPGDSLKSVHWGASARQQNLIVREFHGLDCPRWLVVIDGNSTNNVGTEVSNGVNSSFEVGVRIAASLLQFAQQQQKGLTLYIESSQSRQFKVQPGQQSIAEHLQDLAWVAADGTRNYSEAIRAAQQEQGQQAVLITVRVSSQELQLHSPSGHIDIVISEESYRFPMAQYKEGWTTVSQNQLRLDIHQLSDLTRVFSQ